MLTALANAGDKKAELEALMSESDHSIKVEKVTALFRDLGIDTRTQTEIDKYYEIGINSIEGVEMDAHWKAQLMGLVTKLMGRQS